MSSEVKTGPAKRMDWVDIIKATSVVLVVLLHVTQSLAFALDGTFMEGFWNSVNTFLEPLRMPVFFVVSGVLASSAVKRPWSHTKARTIGIAYLFLLWHTLLLFSSMAVDLLAKGAIDGGVLGKVQEWFVQIFITPGGYWYFYALVLYFVLARLLRNVNPWLVLAVAASLNLARPLVTSSVNTLLEPLDTSNMMASVALNAVYFLAGVYLVDMLKDYSLRNDSNMLIGTATVAVLGSLARMVNPQVAGASFLPIAVAWVLTAILIAVRLQDNERVVAFGRYVGPRTLPIFVIQFVVLDGVYAWFGLTGGTMLDNSPILQAVYPIVTTLAITAGALWLYDLAMRNKTASLLFKAPATWTARPKPAAVVGEPVPHRTGSLPVIPVERDHRATGELRAVRL